MSRKKGHKLSGSFAPLITHTRKSAAWQMLPVGARALFMELQAEYFTDIEGYVFLSARDGAKRLRANKDSVCIWFKQLEHYGFIAKVRDAHLAGLGEGESAHYRLTDRYYHGKPPTRDFEKWDGEVFENRAPVRIEGTPRPDSGDISPESQEPLNGNSCPDIGDIRAPDNCPGLGDISRFTTGSASSEGLADPNFNPILSWLCIRTVYHQEMNKICDEIANIGEAA
jgi:hypothetical protein